MKFNIVERCATGIREQSEFAYILRLRHAALLAVCLLGITAGPTVAGPLADYGDAADGVLGRNYPSLFGSLNAAPGLNAPFHHATTREWLGLAGPPSTTTTEINSLQVDLDFDDAGSTIFRLTAAGIGARGYLYTSVSYNPALSAAGETRFLNSVVDFNSNGRFGDITLGQREWVVRNLPINLSILPAGVTNLNVFAGFPLNPALVGLENVQARVTLSTEPVPTLGLNDWDGSGPLLGFARGETEDVVVDKIVQLTIDPMGNIGGPLINLGPKLGGRIVPVAARWNPLTPVIDGFHALTPAGPGALAAVGTFTFSVPPVAAAPAGLLSGAAVLHWTRVCDIPNFECVHFDAFLGPNPVAARLLGVTPLFPPAPPLPAPPVLAGSLPLPGVGAPARGWIKLVPGLNPPITVFARFPNRIPGDTHTRLGVLVDPDNTLYATYDSFSDSDATRFTFGQLESSPNPPPFCSWALALLA